MFKGRFTFILICFILAFTNQTNAQKWEIGGMFGASNYNGDLARELVLKESHLAGGVFFRYNLGKFFSVKPAFQMGTISGNDKNFSENKYRNLSFKSRISEFSTVMEYNFKPFGTQVRTESFTPYIALGVSLFHFNPKAKFYDEWYELRNLRTEGQTSKSIYKLTQISIPFGMGLKWTINKNFTAGFEFMYRRTFTDYLDDVSTTYPNLAEHTKTHGALSASLSDRSAEVDGVPEPLSTPGDMRGDPGLKDWYVFTMFSFSYRFTPIICWPNKPSTVWNY